MKFNDKVPIYYQIKQYIYKEIIVEHLEPGDKLPSVRQLAVDLTVNVNTIQRALSDLVDEGILDTQRGRGNFVTNDMKKIMNLKRQVVENQLAEMYRNLNELQITDDEIIDYVNQYIENRKEY